MNATRYRVSFQDAAAPGGWVQALAEGCQVRVTRIVCAPPACREQCFEDEVPLRDAAEHATLGGMSSAEVVLWGIGLCDARFRAWLEAQMHAEPRLHTVVIAQFDGLEGADLAGDTWQGWAHYTCAVEAEGAALLEVQATGLSEDTQAACRAGRVTLVAMKLGRSQCPSPLVVPPDLKPGDIFTPYVPLQFSTAGTVPRWKSLSQRAIEDIAHEEDLLALTEIGLGPRVPGGL